MLKLIFWIVVGVLALSFFGISLRAIITSPIGQDNLGFLWMLVVQGWDAIVQFFTSLLPHQFV
ncbi:MAG: hypothetical protein WDN10_00745 [bacterium]